MVDAVASSVVLDPSFERALAHVFRLEGGLADHVADRGGLTKFGVSLAYLRSLGADRGGDIDLDGDVDAADVLALTPAKAKVLFRRDFWQPSGAADAATLSEEIATKLFEFAIVAGPARAVRALQRALGDTRDPVEVDGHYGEQTHGALRRVNWAGLMGELLQALRRRCAEHFARIIDSTLRALRRHPGPELVEETQLAFAFGWFKRALDLEEERV